MTKKKKKKYSEADTYRLFRKVCEERAGERELTASSASAADECSQIGNSPLIEQRRKAGSTPTRRQGIRLATEEILASNPDLDEEEAWSRLGEADVHDYFTGIDWNVWTETDEDGDRVYDQGYVDGKCVTPPRTKGIARSSWVRRYFSDAKKTARNSRR